MKLRYSPTSPYVRKVMVSLLELGLRDRVELQATNVWDPETDIGLSNPLGKVPALILDNGQVLFDSPVICEYLDAQIPQVVLFPAVGEARWKALRFQALGDGLMDAGVLRLLEGRRDPAQQSEGWKDRQLAAINRGLDALEAGVNDLSGGPLTIGQISVACALGWIEFRLGDHNLLSTRPLLKSWYEGFKARASMQVTEPKGMSSAEELIKTLGLQPHPEGGYYAETFRDDDGTGARGSCTAIYYLLKAGEKSHWHKVDAVEIWHWYAGAPLNLFLSEDGKTQETVLLGNDIAQGQRPQGIVPKDVWQAAQSCGDWTLVGCTVSPAFEFDGFVMAEPGWEPK